MSTDLEQNPAAQDPIHSVSELEGWFAAGCKPVKEFGLGLEYERLGVFSDTGRAIPYFGRRSVRTILQSLVHEHGWSEFREADNPIALSRAGTHLTLEPGGQTELSSRVHRDLGSMRDELCGFLEDLHTVSTAAGISWLGLGVQPFSGRQEIGWVPKARYGLMSTALGRTGRLAHDMMKRTAGIQLNLDYTSEDDAAAKFRALMGAAPLITALFANSPLEDGRVTGLLSTRAAIWLETDPARCGLLKLAFEDRPFFRAYLDYALDVPMIFVVREGRWLPVGVSFRQFIADGYRGLEAQVGDWQLHLTTLFPDIRLKQIIEARVADSCDASLAMAHAALLKGIVYDSEATQRCIALVDSFSWENHLALHAAVSRDGLRSDTGGRTLLEMAGELVQLARDGLRRQALPGEPDETIFLAPLQIILRDGESPGRRLLRLWKGSLEQDPARLVAHLGQVKLACYDS